MKLHMTVRLASPPARGRGLKPWVYMSFLRRLDVAPRTGARLSAELGRGFDKSNLWNMRAFFSVFKKSTHCVENYPGHIIGYSFGWKNRRLALFTRLKQSIPCGPRENSNDRSIHCYLNGWLFRVTKQVSWSLPKKGTRYRNPTIW